MDKLKKLLNIDETFTKPIKKEKKFTKIKDGATLIEGYNYMADITYLPETKKGFKYLLVIVDLATKKFDIEPLKTKTTDEVLIAVKKMFKRKYIKLPKGSIRTDNGAEFKGNFHEYLKDNEIFHSVSMPYRHQQLSMVESLNKQLNRLFNGYMNAIEKKTKKPYKEWTDAVDTVRDELNKIREVKPLYNEKTIFDHKDEPINMSKEPKFKVGDLVHYKLSYPENALGNKQPTANFRVGDYRWSSIPKKIERIFYYSGAIPYRYSLKDMDYVSFPESELMESDEKEEKFKVKKIIGKKKEKNIIYYLVWWDGYKKDDATWEPKTNLIKDDLLDYIKEYEDEQKK